MTIETLPNNDLQYYLISYDKEGRERWDDPDTPSGVLSQLVKQELRKRQVTDVFFMSHGWKGDIPAAKKQYIRWIEAMLQCKEDREKMRRIRPDFCPLLIGLHWPSMPWGDEELGSSPMSFDPNADPVAPLVDDAVDKIADTEEAKEALRVIFSAALEDISPTSLPPEVADAYKVLQREAGLTADGPTGAPGSDAEEFNPERMYQEEVADNTVSFGLPGTGGILTVLRQLSFWKMKKRAREFGERGAAALLRVLQGIAGDKVRFHLMGHSFGCIVVSGAVAGANSDNPSTRSVNSLFLVQGALSHWAYCSDIPVAHGNAGYFHAIISKKKVTGPIITTLSEYDAATGSQYPIAAGVGRQVSFSPGELPKYGALGNFGIQGPGTNSQHLEMLDADGTYGFQRGGIYNLESSRIIRGCEDICDAHNDIAHAEVAHAFWEAVMV